MRFLSFSDETGQYWAGKMVPDGIQPLGMNGQRVRFSDLVAAADGFGPVGPIVAPETVNIEVPLDRASTLLCVGLNYREHAAEGGHAIPDYPALFMRTWHSLTAHGRPLLAPAISNTFDYEAELAVVIGKRSRRLTPETALDAVLGYTIFNDGSVRAYQRKGAQWTPGKNFDRTGSLGPVIVTPDEVPPGAMGLGVRTLVDGDVLQNGNTSDMIFSVADILVIVSAFMTLEPGDVIAMGTPVGVGFARKPPRWLVPGMSCSIEIEGIGTLTNPIFADSALEHYK